MGDGVGERVAVVSDIHGSRAALEAVVEDLRETSPDVVLQGGDLAVNGPDPNGVIDIVREQGWKGVVGNTDEMMWKLHEMPRQLERMPKLETLLRAMYEHTAPAAREQLSADNLQWLQQLPTALEHDRVRLVHATPDNLWRAPPHDASDEELENAYHDLEGSVVVYGHIHRPFVRTVQGTTFANSGSVGLTWDRDPRASYVVIDDANVMIRRVEYDIERDVRAILASKTPHAEWLATMRTSGRFIRPEGTNS